MTNEEKDILEFIKINNKHKYCTKDDVDFLLNLIEKQQSEIEVLKDQTEYVINEYGETIEELSKMIDLMAEQLTSPINDKEWVIKFYEKEAKKNNG